MPVSGGDIPIQHPTPPETSYQATLSIQYQTAAGYVLIDTHSIDVNADRQAMVRLFTRSLVNGKPYQIV
jgi:hypothetical protein